MAIRIVQLGTARARGEGVRIGTVRRPPRGVPKSRFASGNWYDVWLPALSPSAEIIPLGLKAQAEKARGAKSRSEGGSDALERSERDWATFVRRYRAEMARPESQRLLDLLAALSRQTDFSVGCYCDDESRCHRSVLRELLIEHGAEVR